MHLNFPFAIKYGSVEQADDQQWVLGLIEQVLFTAPGERVNRPQFGCGVQQLVFEPNSDSLAAASEYLITSELQRYLAGIAKVESVAVRAEAELLSIDIAYVNLLTNTAHQVTLPRASSERPIR